MLALLWFVTTPLAKGNAKLQLEISSSIFFPFQIQGSQVKEH